MAYDVEAGLGGAATGAEAGSMILPGIGTAIGGVVGGLAGFLKKPDAPQLSDPNKGTVDSQIYQLTNSHIGADLASRQASEAKRQSNLSMENIKNRPGFNNASVLSGLYDASNRNAEGIGIDAGLKGAAFDQQQKAEGAKLAMQEGQNELGLQKENLALKERPNALESAGLSALGNFAGKGVDALSNLNLSGGSSDPASSAGSALSGGIQQALGGDLGAAGRNMRLPSQGLNFDDFGH